MRAAQICKCRHFVLHLFEAKVGGSETRTGLSRETLCGIKKNSQTEAYKAKY